MCVIIILFFYNIKYMFIGNNYKKYFYLLTFFVAVLFIFPLLAKAYDGNFVYRSTVLGKGVEQFPGGYNRIVGESNSFNTRENIYALSRVFNITDVQSFQIKHELYRNGVYYKDYYSEYYRPGGRWWAETYAWNNMGNLPSGNYSLKVYSRKGNSAFDFHREVFFNVAKDYNNYYQPYNNYLGLNFNFVDTYVGTGVRDMGIYVYEIVNQKENFFHNEPLYVIGRLAEIRGIERFKMKYDLYLNGAQYKTLYSWEQKPNYEYWPYNYTWVNFGNLPVGIYSLQTSININGGSYVMLNTKTINVYDAYCRDYWYFHKNYCWNRDYMWTDFGNNKELDYGNEFRYEWTKIGTEYKWSAWYEYQPHISEKSNFSSGDRLSVLTKIDNTEILSNYQIRHELWRGNKIEKIIESEKIHINYSSKGKEYFWSNFNYLYPGSYQLKVLVRTNDTPYKIMDSKYLQVDYGNYSYSYNNPWY